MLSIGQIVHLLTYLEPLELEENDVLIQEGDESDTLYFIESGQVSIYLNVDDQKWLRLYTLVAGTLVGELSFVLDTPRTATVRMDTKTTVYRLDRETMLKMEREAPELAIAFKDLLSVVLAERIIMMNKFVALN